MIVRHESGRTLNDRKSETYPFATLANRYVRNNIAWVMKLPNGEFQKTFGPIFQLCF